MGAPRTVDIGPERIQRWLLGFAERHENVVATSRANGLLLTAADGASADLTAAFPLPRSDPGADLMAEFVAQTTARRVLGVLLVRLGGYAAGVFDGDEVVASKVGARLVHGRSAAGGWSQHRFARRREGQAKVALDAATGNAAAILLPHVAVMAAVVTGGDRQSLRTVLADDRLVTLRPLVSARILDVPDPRARVLRDAANAARAIRVVLTDPG